MFDVLFIQHESLTQVLLDEIIKVKSAAWPYSYDQQYNWIKNNLKNSDIHVLLRDREKVVAYLNLVKIEVQIENSTLNGFGIGNVCAIEKGKGWGKELLIKVNQYLINHQKVGLLFCKEKLTKFYLENDWILVPDHQMSISNIQSQIFTFTYNAPENFTQLKYDGVLF
ncbi:GNAT family N-acetyltransferase [Chryseobacterium sp. 2TAF14]|uniref:GNAT family N-acetyltransferase n=1 Tax=Chryseobacterium sp. 2TAF14 TaxID=3233007 RepID=UPI003F90712B